MRKVKRHKNFDLQLEIKKQDFIGPPREAQRHWLLNKMMSEFVDDLVELDAVAEQFVPGTDEGVDLDRGSAMLDDRDIMEDWQIVLMEAMVAEIVEEGGGILEVGFGRGIAADMIQQKGAGNHVIIECNPHVLRRFDEWVIGYPDQRIEIVPGKWEDTIASLGKFDGILFHTYPLSENEVIERVHQAATFAEHFFDVAIQHLNLGGKFTYVTNERNSLSRGHQRALLNRFSRVNLRLLRELLLPPDTRDALWWDQTVVVSAER